MMSRAFSMEFAGKPCTRKAVGRMRSLSLGFGTPAHPKTKPSDVGYREWEIGSYRSALAGAAWRSFVVREKPGCG